MFPTNALLLCKVSVLVLCVKVTPSSAWGSPSWPPRRQTGRQWESSRPPPRWLTTSPTGHRTFKSLTLLLTTLQWTRPEMQVSLRNFSVCIQLRNWPLNAAHILGAVFFLWVSDWSTVDVSLEKEKNFCLVRLPISVCT